MNAHARRTSALIISFNLMLTLSFISFISFTSTGCSISDSIFPDNQSRPTPRVTEPKEPAELNLDAPPAISNARLVRRLSIDFLFKLPSAGHIKNIVKHNTTIPEIVTNYLAKSSAAANIATRHLRIWNLAQGNTPDLERFAKKNSALKNLLTTQAKKNITGEATYVLRKILESGRPFGDLFSLPWSIVHTDSLSIFSETSSEIPWVGEPYRFLKYSDNRPEFGIISSRGINSSIDSGQDDSNFSHTASLLKKFTCNPMDAKQAHLFYSLTSVDFESGLSEYALTNSSCANCHKKFQYIAPDLAGFSRGQNLSDWLSYDNTTESSDALYAGNRYSSPMELATLIAHDPRIQLCEIKKLAENILQRPIYQTDDDQNMIAAMTSAFLGNGKTIMSSIKILSLSKTYSSDVQDSKVGKKFLGFHSGVKFIQANQLRDIFSSLSNKTKTIEIPTSLYSGINDLSDADHYSPSGTYFHDMNRFVRLAATAIVKDELADLRSTDSRNLFKKIPNGSGYSADDTIINAQIISLWEILTSLTFDETNPDFILLKSIWTSAATGVSTNDESSRKAWQAILIAMLLSPEFFMY